MSDAKNIGILENIVKYYERMFYISKLLVRYKIILCEIPNDTEINSFTITVLSVLFTEVSAR